MEYMTFMLFAVVHGDSEPITESHTYEAETKEELVRQLSKDLSTIARSILPEVGR